ncbi:glycoside hydrolase family 2 protein [Marinilabilia rubra]|uniref:Beta-galactosidase n=1 Tax=Marinilabilia rubra TaxID=2162893 RepID=A0A2U2B7L1_9BACT|nr:glycoside hydrolase family 2 TIM barrel-domain containing protein [Marinilabilia rubra]PWD99048.1 beta-galactosidase [Marinilabilia rubra]
MKISFFSILLFLVLLSSCADGERAGKLSFNDDWRFMIQDDSVMQNSAFFQSDFDDSSWENVCLPHTAKLEPLTVNDQWQGSCWYRKSFFVPEIYDEKEIWIEFEAAMNHSLIWINGIEVSENNGGYLPVVVDATDFIIPGKENVVTVRLNNEDNPVTGPKPLTILDFNMYGGLYRNAWLIVKNKVHISHPVLEQKEAGGGIFITTPVVDEKQSVVNVKTHIKNNSDSIQSVKIVQELLLDGNLILEQTSKNDLLVKPGEDIENLQTIKVDNARLWSPDSPKLYNLKTKVLIDQVVVDSQDTRFGIRSFEFKGNELYINGEKTFLRGVNRHQEYPFVGYALSDNAQYRDAWKIKEAGYDYVRLSHYPHSPAFMDACDELGLVSIDAILGWQYYLDSDAFREYCYRSARDLVYRDRNHASVLAWEVSLNETQMPRFFMQELHDIVHRQYPGENTYTAGWKNEVYDIYFQARQHRIKHYDSIQIKPYVVSEYGDWEYFSMNAGLNQHEYGKELRYELSSRQKRGFGESRLLQQVENVQEAHNDNLNTPAFADGYWVMYDYNRGYDDEIEHSGIMDIFRLPKFSTYFFKSQRDIIKDTTLFIASYWNNDSPLDVKVFSNCDEVALYLNDELIEKRKPDSDSISYNLKHPPFTFSIDEFSPGELKAKGYIEDQLITEHVVKTPEDPVSLKLWVDKSNKEPEAGCNDLLFLYIAGVDENGTIVPDFTEKIDLLLDGDAEIMNVGKVQAEAGIATALVRIGKTGGSISLAAKSEKGLNGAVDFLVTK